MEICGKIQMNGAMHKRIKDAGMQTKRSNIIFELSVTKWQPQVGNEFYYLL